MKLSILPLVVLLALSSCAGHALQPDGGEHPGAASDSSKSADESEAKNDKAAELAKKVDELEHKLHVAEVKLQIAKMDINGKVIARTQKREGAQQAFKVAKANLANFDAIERPSKVGRAQMSLKGAQDQAKEANEELEQLALMYADQNLEEMTSEFVISRGKRRAERAAKRIGFAEMDLRSLMGHKLRLEQEKLAIAVKLAGQALKALDRGDKKDKLSDSLKMLEATRAVSKAKDALSEAQEDGDQS